MPRGSEGSFELHDRAVVFGQVPRQSQYGAIDFALDFLGHKGTTPLDLAEFTGSSGSPTQPSTGTVPCP